MTAPLRPLRLFAPLLAAGLLAVAADASAGVLAVRDEAHVLTSGDVDALRAVVQGVPFDARFVTTTAYPDQAGLGRFVGSLVAEPSMVVVGVDPQHHHVQVHFGTASHVPEAAWAGIERAGNDAFKRGAWEEGGADIFRAAAQSVTSAAPTGGVVAPAPVRSTSIVGPLVLLLLIGGIVAVVAFALRRRGPGYGGGGYGGGSYGGGYGGGGYYGPGPQGGGMGALGGGVIGAGLGGIAGYELGKMEGERERGHDDGGFVGGDTSGGSNDGGSYDAGGGGSSWDDSGGGGGGGDFGGGDAGGGGGSDF